MVFGLEPINQAILGNNYIFCVLCLWLFLQKSGDLNISFFLPRTGMAALLSEEIILKA